MHVYVDTYMHTYMNITYCLTTIFDVGDSFTLAKLAAKNASDSRQTCLGHLGR
jgi:hypothetical protein